MPAKKVKKPTSSNKGGSSSSYPQPSPSSSPTVPSLVPAVVRGTAEAKGRLCSPVGTYMTPCEARIHKPIMEAIGAVFGDLIELSPTTSTKGTAASTSTAKPSSVILRVLPPTDACRTMNRSSDIAVSLDTIDTMGMDKVTIRCLAVPVSVLAGLSLTMCMDRDGSGGVEDQSPSPSFLLPESSMIALEAAFRGQFRMCVVYAGMKTVLRIGTQPIEVCVGSVRPMGSGVHSTSGYLSDGTSIAVDVERPPIQKITTSSPPSSSPPVSSLPTNHTLYFGPSGTGKSHMLDVLASEAKDAGWLIYNFSALEGVGSVNAFVTTIDRLWASIQRRVGVVSTSSSSAGVLVVLDNIDILVGSSSSSSEGPAASLRFCAALSELMSRFQPLDADTPPQALFVASASSLGSFPTQLLCPQQFGKRCVPMLPPASPADRRKVLSTLFKDYLSSKDGEGEDGVNGMYRWNAALDEAAKNSHGFNQRDLAKVRSTAAAVAFESRGSTTMAPSDLASAAKAVRPSALSTVEVAIPNVKWSDIGGSDEAKAVLKEYVEWCLGEQRWVFESLRLPPPKGVLLYGPPGCSKTMLAKALANESKMNFVSVKGPEVFSKWVGDSEKAVRRVFAQARAAAPCVVFIDELDGMCGHRGSGGVGDRVISQLLTELDGLPAAISSASDNIILVAATNRPENIDGAVLRPGRIDRRVYVGLPNKGERRAIAELSLGRIPCVTSEVNADVVADRTEGYTGAEVVAVCKETSFQALTRSMEAEAVMGVDFEAALVKVRPRVSKQDVDWYLQWGKQSTV